MENLLNKYNLGAYINITADEHLNEYIGDSDKRVEYLTGFTGSNGISITCNKNVLFTDSRYYIQAKKELKDYKLMKMGIDPVDIFLKDNLQNKRVGLNPRHFSYTWLEDMKKKLIKWDIELIFIEEDFVDTLFKNKPKRLFNEIYSIEEYKIMDFYNRNLEILNFKGDIKDIMLFKNINEESLVCGKTYKEKLEEVRKKINFDEELIITEMDTICWLFNLRGSDIKFNPLFYSYAVISHSYAKIFCANDLNLKDVETKKYNDFEEYLINSNTKKLLVILVMDT